MLAKYGLGPEGKQLAADADPLRDACNESASAGMSSGASFNWARVAGDRARGRNQCLPMAEISETSPGMPTGEAPAPAALHVGRLACFPA